MTIRALTLELEKVAREELQEDPKKLADGIEHLKEWLTKQPHLSVRTDDQWLAAFLRGCKFSLERAKEKIDLYYSIRKIAPDINCLKPKDPKFMETLKSGFVIVLPKTAHPGAPRVVLLRGGTFEPSKQTHCEAFSVPHFLQQIMLIEDDNLAVSGVINVMDFEGTSFTHFAALTPVIIRKMVLAYQEATPVRMKGTHYLNTPKAFEAVFNIAKSFLNEKIKSRLFVHSKGYETLYQHVPQEILPTEYGGNGGTIQEIIDYWVKKVEAYSAWFEEDSQYGSDESKRPGKPKIAQDMFGLEGSFRQLNFD